MSFSYYRSIGVEHFIIVDNDCKWIVSTLFRETNSHASRRGARSTAYIVSIVQQSGE